MLIRTNFEIFETRYQFSHVSDGGHNFLMAEPPAVTYKVSVSPTEYIFSRYYQRRYCELACNVFSPICSQRSYVAI